MKKSLAFTLVAFLFTFSMPALADDDCASDMHELTALIGHSFPSNWKETSARDHKPMLLRITEQADKLHIVFDKTDEGVWGSGNIEVCKKDDKYQIVATGMRPGSAAPGMLRGMMNGSQKFNLDVRSASSIRVWRTGWGGEFVPGE